MAIQGSPNTIYLATKNRHKAEELDALLSDFGWHVIAGGEVAPALAWDETGNTFLENARIKALALRQHLDGWILADDSGLEVEALNGAPGVHSSCFAGVDGDHAANNAKMTAELDRRGLQSSLARFRCTLLLLAPDETEQVFTGELSGRIELSARGTQGFGYDPLFIPEGHQHTLAEMTAEEKNAISHRGRAVANLKAFLVRFGIDS